MGYDKTMCGTRGLKYWVDSSGSATSRIQAASTSAECLISCSPRIYQCDSNSYLNKCCSSQTKTNVARMNAVTTFVSVTLTLTRCVTITFIIEW
jgi:hypothetical protein